MAVLVHCDEPTTASLSSIDTVRVVGWAISDDEPIARVRITVNGQAQTDAAYGYPRPDVARTYPHTLCALRSGFVAFARTPGLRPGRNVVAVEPSTIHGRRKVLEIAFDWCPMDVSEPDSCPACGDAPVAQDATHGSMRLYECPGCGLGFMWPLPSQFELARYYNEEYKGTEDARRMAHEHPLHSDAPYLGGLLREAVGNDALIYDIGAGVGSLANGLRKEGFAVRAWDLGKASVEAARSILGVDMQHGALRDVRGDPADAIVLRHVIEHSPTPIQDIRHAVGLLRPGGALLLVTPNFDSLAASVTGAYWEWFIPPAHLFYFTEAAIYAAAKAAGASVAYVKTRRGDANPMEVELAALLRTLPTGRHKAELRILAGLGTRVDGRAAIDASGAGEELVALLLRA